MSAGTKVGGICLVLVAGVAAFSWFGNPTPDKDAGPKYPKFKTAGPTVAVSPTGPTERYVLIRYSHREGKTPIHVLWDFGNGNKGGDTVPHTVKEYEMHDMVKIGTTVMGAAQTRDGQYKNPETLNVQIFFDNIAQCPDDFFGKGKLVECRKTVT